MSQRGPTVAYRVLVPAIPQSPMAALRANPRAADLLLAVAVAALTVVGQFERIDGTAVPHRPDAFSLVLCLLASLPIAARRRYPMAVLLVTAAATTAQVGLHYWSTFLGVGVLCAVYTVAAHRSFTQTVVGLGAALVMTWTCLGLAPGPITTSSYFSSTVAMAAAAVVGRNLRHRRRHLVALVERAQHAETDRELWVREAVTAERQRIARELHDMVAHNVSVMGVLAAGARRLLVRDPSAVDDTLATMETTSRSTLREMRHLLDVLRVDDEPASGPPAPQPGTAAIAALVEQVTEAGLPVTLQVSGTVRELAPGVDLSAYRIVQEALTNALKHAGAATATVRLVYGSRALVVTVADDGRGPGGGDGIGGHGLLGMRERVALYGGSLEVGARPDGGFRVRAQLPLDAELVVGAVALPDRPAGAAGLPVRPVAQGALLEQLVPGGTG